MNKRYLFPSLLLLSILGSTLYSLNSTDVRAASFTEGKTLVLYDAASGEIPGESLMDFTDFPPGAASLTYSEGAAVLDTTPSGTDTFAGWISGQAITSEFPVLNRTTGVQVHFSLQVESELHNSNNRAGFSVILLDQDARGIELSFWENEIWAQNDDRTGNLFTHGENIALPTTSLTDYQLTLTEDTYTLTAGLGPLLSGPVRDYSAFEGFPDPYQTPNFLFLGDDSTSSQARIRLTFVSVTGTELVPPTVTDMGTSTNSLPTASFTPPSSATPAPSATPTPTGRVFELCPSGWLFPMAAIAGAVLVKKKGRR